MKRSSALMIVFFSLLFINPLLALGEEAANNTQAPAQAPTTSIIDKVGDWFATLGKSNEEKGKILEERQENRITEQAAQAYKVCKEKTQTEVQNAQAKAAEGIAAAKDKTKNIKDEAKAKAQQKAQQAKEAASQELAACKEKFKNEMDSSLDKAKDFLKNWK
jgi:flagellar biosynthesis/type III secretory pathway protein FliH